MRKLCRRASSGAVQHWTAGPDAFEPISSFFFWAWPKTTSRIGPSALFFIFRETARLFSYMRQTFLAKMKKQLEEEKIRLENELSKFAHRNPKAKETDFTTDFQEMGDKEDESASEVATFSDNLSLEEELEKALRDVETALIYFENGTYGICKYCGAPIDERRLEARPTSTSCIRCKKTLTQEV